MMRMKMTEVFVVTQKIWRDNDTFIGVASTLEEAEAIKVAYNKRVKKCLYYEVHLSVHKVPLNRVFSLNYQTQVYNKK